ncbi:MAG TPA: hypothetical protein VG328_07375 [Stellaceae bacterium]|nr:hypothetical protein [Stellaceae bacterium]
MAEPPKTSVSAPHKPRDRRFELGPHSRLFGRGVIGDLNGNSREAKYLRSVEKAILDHLGGAERATIPQKLYAGRLAKIALRLELFDQKLIEEGQLTDFDNKVYASLHSAFRLMVRDLGLKAAAPKLTSLSEMLAEAAE